MTLTVGSLFSGIGGLDLGLERAGMEVIWQSEIDDYASRVLKKHWAEVPNHGNIKDINWRDVVRPDVLCGGYPCQPFSLTGKRKGEQDPRHLWPYVRRAISELRPRYAILENVPGHISLGLDRVLGDLAEVGYDAEWQLVSAASQGASHLRERLFIVAYPDSSHAPDGRERTDVSSQDSNGRDDRTRSGSDLGKVSVGGSRQDPADVANTNDSRSRTSGHDYHGNGTATQQRREVFSFIGASRLGQDVAYPNGFFLGKRGLATAARKAGERWDDYLGTEEADGSRQWWETEPELGRVVNGIPSRVDRLRGLGNAVVPQVAEFVARTVIAHYEASR